MPGGDAVYVVPAKTLTFQYLIFLDHIYRDRFVLHVAAFAYITNNVVN